METIDVVSCTVHKTGETKTGKPFTLYAIKCQDGREGSSFDAFPIGQCQAEVTQNGKWLNFKPVQKAAAPHNGQPPMPAVNAKQDGKKNEDMLDAIRANTTALYELRSAILSKLKV